MLVSNLLGPKQFSKFGAKFAVLPDNMIKIAKNIAI
jgi:hypothetical protein